MDKPVFSVVIPTYNRSMTLLRAINSLRMQTYGNFECIVVDDASDSGVLPENVVGMVGDFRFECVRLPQHSERVIARKTGMTLSQGDYITWLDSDDEYVPHYFETVMQAIEDYPDAKCFNFGAIVHHRSKDENGIVRYTGTTLRPTFKPAWLGNCHERFKSGKIGTGSFVFHRSVLDAIVPLPDASSPYKLHELATDIHDLYPFPGLSLGNPWGDDWLMVYRITRRFQSVPLDVCLYVQHVRVA
jgi:glycosyltransferase involved in cell wall biosynthesis